MSSDIFNISKIELSNGMVSFDVNNIFRTLGVDKLLAILDTNIDEGINTHEEEKVKRRRQIYGKNIEKKKSEGLLSFVFSSFEDIILRGITLIALISIVVESIENPATGWIEGTSILIIILITCLVNGFSSYTNFVKFQALSGHSTHLKTLTVIRNSISQTILAEELLVGDIAFIQNGDEIDADGVLVKGEVSMDESLLTGEQMSIKKTPLIKVNSQDSNPLILGGTLCADGSGYMVVTAVGDMKQITKIQSTLIKTPETGKLQQYLENEAAVVGKYGMYLSFLILLALIIHFVIRIFTGKGFLTIDTPLYIIRSLLSFLSVVVLAVIEELPLIVTLGLASSVKRLLTANCLVRKLKAVENLAYADELLLEKNGVLTETNLEVTDMFFSDKFYNGKKVDVNEFGKGNIDMLGELICVNTDSLIKLNKYGDKERIGSASELCLITYAQSIGHDYNNYRPSPNLVRVLPFNTSSKRRLTVYKKSETLYRIMVQGISEKIVNNATKYYSKNGIQNLDSSKRQYLEKDVIGNFGTKALRTVAFAYRDVETSNPADSPEQWPEEQLDKELTLFCVIGMKQPLKYSTIQALSQFKQLGITVRMITGDNKLSSTAVAQECGMLSSTETSQAVMEGSEFTALIHDTDMNKAMKRREVLTNLRVLARSTPTTKLELVNCLKALGKTVMVVSESTSDAPAVKNADVGFSFGISGTEIVREVSDVILLDDNINSICNAVFYGRNLMDIIKRVVFFVISGSLAAIGVSLVGSIVNGETPFYSMQALWFSLLFGLSVNYSLVSEAPNSEMLKRKPYQKDEALIDTLLWRSIIIQSVSQVAVLSVLLVMGPSLFQIPNSANNYPWNSSLAEHYTIVFNSFILMQTFNALNARNLREINPFKGISSNKNLLKSTVIVLLGQIVLVQFGGIFSRTAPLSFAQHGICLLIGLTALIFGILGKIITRALSESSKRKEKVE